MVDQTQGDGYCGGYTTEMEYIAGPAFDPTTGGADLSHYTVLPPVAGRVEI